MTINKLLNATDVHTLQQKTNEVIDAVNNGGGGGGSSPSRNVGEVIPSTIPLTDSGLHLLDGSLLSAGSYADFVTYIAGLVSSNPTLFTTESAWQMDVTNTGYCDKFVYDSTNNTVRLPKWGNQLITNLPSTAGVKGNGKSLGLTNGSVDLPFSCTYTPSSIPIAGFGQSAQLGSDVGTSTSTYTTPLNLFNKTIGVSTDATKSGIVADLTSLTKANVYYYIVIANSTKTAIEVDIDEIATDLNGKMDVDMSNMSASSSAKKMIDNWGCPDYSSGVGMGLPSQPLSTTTTTYTCPSAGYCFFWVYHLTNGGMFDITVNGGSVATIYGGTSANGLSECISFPVSKNDVVLAFTNATYATFNIGWGYFYPLKGE